MGRRDGVLVWLVQANHPLLRMLGPLEPAPLLGWSGWSKWSKHF